MLTPPLRLVAPDGAGIFGISIVVADLPTKDFAAHCEARERLILAIEVSLLAGSVGIDADTSVGYDDLTQVAFGSSSTLH